MSAFRDVLVVEMDEIIFATLADDIEINGRPERGMFSAPWLAPKIGRLQTAIIEPQVIVRDTDAVGIENDAIVKFDGDEYEIVSIEPDGTGITKLVLRPML
jgi:hypothetical protein